MNSIRCVVIVQYMVAIVCRDLRASIENLLFRKSAEGFRA